MADEQESLQDVRASILRFGERMDRQFNLIDRAVAGLHQRVCEVEEAQERTQSSLGPALTDLAKVVKKLADGQERQDQQQIQQQRMLYELTTAIAGLTRQDSDGNTEHVRLRTAIENQSKELGDRITEASKLADKAVNDRNYLRKVVAWMTATISFLGGFLAWTHADSIIAATKAAVSAFKGTL
jgi:predicted  nucleic acid-binding Zn-ribbon protein